MKLVSRFLEMCKGDVLVLRDKAIMLREDKRLTELSLCNRCAIRDSLLCVDGGSHVCSFQEYFTHVKPTEEIERARDLFALKGELL